MPNWLTTVRVGDLHAVYKAGGLISYVALTLADRLRKNLYADMIGYEIGLLEEVMTVEEYDDVLERLYDFGDEGHRIWFDPTP